MNLRAVVKFARKQGWRVEQTRRKTHVQFINPEGRVVATASGSASDHRSLLNTVAHLRAAGLPVPHKGGHTPRERNNA